MIDSKASDWTREHYKFEFSRLHNEAFETPVGHPAVVEFRKAAAGVVGDEPPIGWIASCDGRLFYHRGGMPTITFGPGELGDAHSLHEQIKIADILRAAEVLVRYLMRWCGVRD